MGQDVNSVKAWLWETFFAMLMWMMIFCEYLEATENNKPQE